MKKGIRFSGLLQYLVLLVFFASCKSLPEERAPAELMEILPQEENLYLWVVTEPMRPLINDLLTALVAEEDLGGLDQLLDQSRQISGSLDFSAAVMASDTSDTDSVGMIPIQGLNAALSGEFKRSLIRMALNSNRDWEGKRGESGRWSESDSGLQVAIPDRSILLVSSGSIEELQNRYKRGEGVLLDPDIESGINSNDF